MTGQTLPRVTFDAAGSRIRLLHAEFATKAEAEAFAATFPKALRVRVHSMTYGNGQPTTWTAGIADVVLSANAVNGGENEAGVKRVRRFVKGCRAAGFEPVRRVNFTNDISDEDVAAIFG